MKCSVCGSTDKVVRHPCGKFFCLKHLTAHVATINKQASKEYLHGEQGKKGNMGSCHTNPKSGTGYCTK